MKITVRAKLNIYPSFLEMHDFSIFIGHGYIKYCLIERDKNLTSHSGSFNRGG